MKDARTMCGVLSPILADDVLLHFLRGRCCERGDRNTGKFAGNDREGEVIRPEIISPFGDAVRFVDGKEREVDVPERFPELPHGEPFQRDVEELGRPSLSLRLIPDTSSSSSELFMKTASMPFSLAASTWSFIKEMSKVTITAVPCMSSAGS